MKTIRLSDVGVLPNTDITRALHALFLAHPGDTEFFFEDADYYLSPEGGLGADYRLSNSAQLPMRTLGVWMKEMKNCALRGNGARLWCRGQMQPFTLDRCESVTVEGFTVNWRLPLVAEAVAVGKGNGFFDIRIDAERYPHVCKNGTLYFFDGTGAEYPLLWSLIFFDPQTRRVRAGTGDIRYTSVSDLGDCVYRFTSPAAAQVTVGDLVNVRHGDRYHAGLFAEKCRDLRLADLVFHATGGLGCLVQFCRDVTIENVAFSPDEARGRAVSSGRDDGIHLASNMGTVTVMGCRFHALMDDPMNLHGCCTLLTECVDETMLRCRFGHEEAKGFLYWAEAGDTVSFIERKTMQSLATATVASYTLETDDTFLLTLDTPITREVQEALAEGKALAIENLTHTAALVCTGNHFGSGRARGLLVSTPKSVLIADNVFESSGSAILIAGDANYWFESGAVRDVLITRNHFTKDCLSSSYAYSHGVISISPEIPAPDVARPFHRNIRITDNRFELTDARLLYAASTDGLVFTGNTVLREEGTLTEDICLTYVRDAAVFENTWQGARKKPMLSIKSCEAVAVEPTS